ncbi:MAG: amylo-alpha-1,6-glucosidase [Actinomycetota bacterium]|nr:amylo-alpha-1,6-glucosidase [Actinomycetota bacterium]
MTPQGERDLPRDPVSVVSSGAYCVSDAAGDVAGAGEGLFYKDTRHLSRFVLRVDGCTLAPQSARVQGSTAEFSLTAPGGGIQVVRHRKLGGGMREEIRVKNDSSSPVEVRVELECDTDFIDLFEVRGYHRPVWRREVSRKTGDSSVYFAYHNSGFRRATRVYLSGEGVEPIYVPGGVSFVLNLGPREERTLTASVALQEGEREAPWAPPARLYEGTPVLKTDHKALLGSWNRGVEDLGSLAFEVKKGLLVPAAGAPWYVALFGRDALITAFQTMFLDQEPARNVLRALASYQATGRDDFRDAEPGKILHELRRGELSSFGEVPHSPYYGTVDATPLFLVLLHEVWRWTADDDFARELEAPARGALGWLLEHTDANGYVDYEARSERGLKNQGWKDSGDCILFRDGAEAKGPISLCEVQGYAYDAYTRTAELAGAAWDDSGLTHELRQKAASLKERFDRDFWVEDGGYYALALDGEGRRVDSLTSNIGHLLLSGIVPESKARAVADHLLGERLMSGFGIRTMAEGEGGYNAEGYHTGSVWPHDNSLIAYGLSRYGFREEACLIALAILDAAPRFDYRLPEVFAGYSRKERPAPVPYPTSCRPQAWAAGAVPLLLRAMLGVEPEPRERRLLTDPALLGGVSAELSGVPAFGGQHDLRA